MKFTPLYYFVLVSRALAATLPPPSASLTQTENLPTDTAEPIPFNYEIKPGDLNRYLHPDATYTDEHIDCADGQPILSGETVIGCFFINEEEDVDRAIEAITIAKNLTNENPEALPPTPQLYGPENHSQLQKRGPWALYPPYCFGAGVYSNLEPDFRETSDAVCASMHAFGGRNMASASWTIRRRGGNLGLIMYATGTSWPIQHDYFFRNIGKDNWVYTNFRTDQACFIFINHIVQGACRGGNPDSQGGWADGYDYYYGASRTYRIGVDPNRDGQPNS
ncbi:hypothetical protein TWF730_011198 [Orbilia blumenaviensis]|uniref:Uncharacterized protein n=1 Tax=Orbilia blumenaviensis TaxID=1796055 RepID=A0AAV9UNE2_9PEZI